MKKKLTAAVLSVPVLCSAPDCDTLPWSGSERFRPSRELQSGVDRAIGFPGIESRPVYGAAGHEHHAGDEYGQ